MRRALSLLFTILMFVVGCRKNDEPDAYGNIEAVDVVVGAETSGRIEQFSVHDGDHLPAGAMVGTIETNTLREQLRQISAQSAATASRINEIAQQIDGLQIQREIARRAYERTRRLYTRRAATAQQLDQTERDFRVLGEQIDAARAQQQSIRDEVKASEARVAEVNERIEKGVIRNPVDGTVLVTYAESGEVTQAGQPLYRIADLRNVEVRAYVVETQLASVRPGLAARVTVDSGKGRVTLNGTVTWVSSDAEFTPTPIQTRDERADLVYAVKIRVPNGNGILKIGMPADVDFANQVASK